MTFDEWWKENGIEWATFVEKSAARKGWKAGANSENEACAKVLQDNADACGEESIMRHILESQILAIRARRK